MRTLFPLTLFAAVLSAASAAPAQSVPANLLGKTTPVVTNEQGLAALRLHHYGSPDTVESPPHRFTFSGGTLTGYTAMNAEEVVPWQVGGVIVTSIGYNAFYNCQSLRSVTLPAGVTSIGEGAFRFDALLASVNIGAGVTSIGGWAFYSCTNLASVTLPAGVTSIGDSAFSNCKGLKSAAIPAGVTSVGQSAFVGCTNLTSVTIPAGVTSINKHTFNGCASLTNIIFLGDAPTVGAGAFTDTHPGLVATVANPLAAGWGTELSSAEQSDPYPIAAMSIPVVRPALHAEALYMAGQPVATAGHVSDAAAALAGLVRDATNAVTQALGPRIDQAADMVLVSHTNLTEQFTQALLQEAWARSTNAAAWAESVRSGAAALTWGVSNTLSAALTAAIGGLGDLNTVVTGHTSDADIHLTGPQAQKIASALTGEQDLAAMRNFHYGSADIVECPTNWFTIDAAGMVTDYDFAAGRENVVIPWMIGGVSVTGIGAAAFSGTPGDAITNVIAPRTLAYVGFNAFATCPDLVSVSMPSVKVLDYGAFYFCLSASTISVPSVSSIGELAFSQCSSLQSLVFTGDAPTVGANAFDNAGAGLTVTAQNPQATGWGTTLSDGARSIPVVRPALRADAVYQAGLLVATANDVEAARAAAEALAAGIEARKDLYADTATNVIWRLSISNGVPTVRAYTNTP